MWKKLLGTTTEDKPLEWRYDDLPTPETAKEFIDVGTSSLDAIYKKLTSDHDLWSFVSKEGDGIVLEETDMFGSNSICVRGTVTMYNIDFDKLVIDMFIPTPDARRQVYDELLDHQVLTQFDENTVLSYSQYKSPTFVTNRDFLCIWSRRQLKDGWLFSIESVNSKDHPFRTDFVRATTSGGILIQKVEDEECYNLTMIEHIDPRGWVPTIVTNMFKRKVADRMKLIRSVYTK